MEQLSLFNCVSKGFYEKLQDMLEFIMTERELPAHSLHLFSNKSTRGKNAGKEMSKSICIY